MSALRPTQNGRLMVHHPVAGGHPMGILFVEPFWQNYRTKCFYDAMPSSKLPHKRTFALQRVLGAPAPTRNHSLTPYLA